MSSTSLELQTLALLPGDVLRPLGAFEELYCLFDQQFPINGALAAKITGPTTVQQWRAALDAVQQRHPLLSACIDTTFNRVPHFRRVTEQRIPLRVVTSPNAQWQQEIAEEVNAPFTPIRLLSSVPYCSIRRRTASSSSPLITLSATAPPASSFCVTSSSLSADMPSRLC